MNSFDINYAILQQQHPYYSLQLCSSDTFLRESCEESKYDLLQLWCWPDKSVKELRKLYPKITFSEVAQLCLVYHPINESVNYYDPLTCFYHACRTKQEDAIRFIPSLKDHYNETIIAILFICYKYDRVDIILEWEKKTVNTRANIALSIMRNTIYTKLGETDITKFNAYLLRYAPPAYFTDRQIMQSSMLFEKEELLELCVHLALAGSPDSSKMLSYLSMKDNYVVQHKMYEDFIYALVEEIGKERSQNIIRKYISDFQIVYSDTGKPGRPRIYWNSVLSKYRDVGNSITTAQAMFIPDLVKSVLTGTELAVYYISSGQFDKFIAGKYKIDTNISIEGKEQILKVTRPLFADSVESARPNVYGVVSLNRELSKLSRIGMNDTLETPKTKDIIGKMSAFRNFKKK